VSQPAGEEESAYARGGAAADAERKKRRARRCTYAACIETRVGAKATGDDGGDAGDDGGGGLTTCQDCQDQQQGHAPRTAHLSGTLLSLATDCDY